MIPVKSKKYTLNNLRGLLSNGKSIDFCKKERVGNINYNIDVLLWRIDIVKGPFFSGETYDKETYILTIEKYDSKYPGDQGELPTDQRLEFHKLEEARDYLDKKDILKKEDWIIEDE